MDIQFYKSHNTRNISGFGLDHPVFGRIFMGHFDPIHKVPDVEPQMRPIFEYYDIIVGDMNAGWHRLIKPTKYSKKSLINPKNTGYVYNPISYLTPVQPSDPRDARLDMVVCKYNQPLPIDVGVSFDEFHKHKTPRQLMRVLGFPSDHRPLKTSIEAEDDYGEKHVLILAFWNVSDPVYWSRYYPAALEGYELEGDGYTDLAGVDDNAIDMQKEHNRLESILVWVDHIMDNCNVVGLAEVPVRLISDLQMLAKKHGMSMEYRSEHSDIWRPNDPISQMVVMWK